MAVSAREALASPEDASRLDSTGAHDSARLDDCDIIDDIPHFSAADLRSMERSFESALAWVRKIMQARLRAYEKQHQKHW